MLYVIYGTDREKGRVLFQNARARYEKEGSLEIVREGTISQELFDRMGASQGLFVSKAIFILDSVLEKKDEQELLVANGAALSASSNIILVFEPSLGKSIISEIEEHAFGCIECSAPKKESRPGFNIFALGDALGKRNKKDLWMLYRSALEQDISPEEISGTLFWSLKNIALMQGAKPGDGAGLNPFVARKTRDFAKLYTREEVVGRTRDLVRVYHRAHLGEEDMEIGLEKFILSL